MEKGPSLVVVWALCCVVDVRRTVSCGFCRAKIGLLDFRWRVLCFKSPLGLLYCKRSNIRWFHATAVWFLYLGLEKKKPICVQPLPAGLFLEGKSITYICTATPFGNILSSHLVSIGLYTGWYTKKPSSSYFWRICPLFLRKMRPAAFSLRVVR